MHLLLGRCPKTKGPITTKFVGIKKIHNSEKNLGWDHMGPRRTLICSTRPARWWCVTTCIEHCCSSVWYCSAFFVFWLQLFLFEWPLACVWNYASTNILNLDWTSFCTCSTIFVFRLHFRIGSTEATICFRKRKSIHLGKVWCDGGVIGSKVWYLPIGS